MKSLPSLPPGAPIAAPTPDENRRRMLRSGVLAATLFGVTPLLVACNGGDDEDDTPAGGQPGTPDSPAGPVYPPVAAPTLVGRAILPANSFVAGPTSGQYINGGDYDRAVNTYGYQLPFVGKQPMQGFSALIRGPKAGTFYALQDNGFGGRAASPDALLHIYAMRPDWTTGRMVPVHFTTGQDLAEFSPESFVRLSDPQLRIGYDRVLRMDYYPGTSTSPAGQRLPVDPLIRDNRLLTGYDIDPESLQRDAQGNFWIGDEFGPFLLKFNSRGELLEREFQVPNVTGIGPNRKIQSPNNQYTNDNGIGPNLPNSGGFESLAINTSGTLLYAMLEAALDGDDRRRRLITVFDINLRNFQSKYYSYRVNTGQRINGDNNLETEYYSVNDMVAINDKEFLVLEKDSGAGDVRRGFPASGTWRNAARFKRIFRIHLDKVDGDGFLQKEEVVDLMQLRDPAGMGGADTIDGLFTFPMETIESVCIVDSRTLAVVNDNNYPGGSPSRSRTAPDNNEFILIRLPQALPLG